MRTAGSLLASLILCGPFAGDPSSCAPEKVGFPATFNLGEPCMRW
jgi:hypothetical protein